MAARNEPLANVLWSVTAFGDERWSAGRRYWWDNRDRPARGGCLQATLEGSVIIRMRGGEHTADAGTLMIFLYGEDSQYGQPAPFTEPYHCVWVSLDGAGVVEHLQAIRNLGGPVLRDEPGRPLTEELLSLQARLREGGVSQPTMQAAATQRLVMGVYESAARHRREELSPVERAVERLLSQPFAPDNAQQIADRYGVSREHFTRIFTQRTGTPPARYLAHVRARRAERLLQSTGLTVDAVARQVGVRDAAALGRLIRRETGAPPSALRSSAAS